jgi:hypothetical protein
MFGEETKRTLAHYKIPIEDVLDARAMDTSQYKIQLKRQNKAVARVTPTCRRGHFSRLRLSSGHCLECQPQGLSYWKKHNNPGFVYVAVSPKLGLIKIGNAQTASDRADSLIRDGYGGTDDWELTYRRKFDRAGWVEAQVHTTLSPYASPTVYTRRGHGTTITAKELFRCDPTKAVQALEALAHLSQGDKWEPWGVARILARFRR